MKKQSLSRVSSALLCLAMCAGSASSVYADDAIVTAGPNGQSQIGFASGAPFYSTGNQVVALRTVQLPDGEAYVLWNEVVGGATKHFYAYSKDGKTLTNRVREAEYTVRLRYANFDPAVATPAIPANLQALPSSELFIVQFWAPPTQGMQQAVEGMGGKVYRFLADHSNIVRIDPSKIEQVARLPYVRWVGQFHPAYKLDPQILGAFAAAGDDAAVSEYTSVEVFERGGHQQQAIINTLRQGGKLSSSANDLGYRFQAQMSQGDILAAAHNDDVHYMDPWGPGGPDMDIVRQFSGANFIETTTGFTGQGVRGEIFDTGIQANHVDFQAPQPPLMHGTPQLDSHGNACYGINFGTGAGNPAARGLNPSNERGIFAQYTQVTQFGGAKTRHALTMESADPNGPYRALYQTSSVGSPQILNYSTISAEVDDYLFLYGLLSTQSQSNTGNMTSRPQAWAKNIVSVGAFNHQNTLIKTDDTWGGASFGPAEDGRIKPDLSHFYDNTTTTYSTSTTGYGTFGGTSNATPVTAGHFGLFFQMWHEGVFPGAGGGASVFDDRPPMTLAKAIMINTAWRYTWTSGGPNANLDRVHQGWGHADLERLYNFRTRFNHEGEQVLLTNGASQVYAYDVNSGEPELNVTMVYKDLMGTTSSNQHRINDISLRVTSPTGQVYWGNNGLTAGNFSTAGGVSNKKDTVENVFIQNPAAGKWFVEVIGDEIVADAYPQTGSIDANYSLVVTGAVGAPAGLFMSLASSLPSLVAPGSTVPVDFKIDEGGDTIVPGSAKLFYRYDGGAFQQMPLSNTSGQIWSATLPTVDCNDKPEFYAQVEGTTTGLKTSPPNAPTNYFDFAVGTTQTTVFYQQDFEGGLPSGWSANGLWGVGANVCSVGTPCAGSTYAYYTQPAGCTFNTGSTNSGTLTSAPINLTSAQGATIEFCYNLETENNSTYDQATVSVNGTQIAQLTDSAGWATFTADISQFAGGNVTLQFKFDTIDSVLNDFNGWQIDGIVIKTQEVTCASSCYADCDGNGSLDFFDFLCYQNEFASGTAYADCDNSGSLDFFDFLCFQNEFAGGCP